MLRMTVGGSEKESLALLRVLASHVQLECFTYVLQDISEVLPPAALVHLSICSFITIHVHFMHLGGSSTNRTHTALPLLSIRASW